jgi:adenine specific DNA methylase Mod
VLLHELLAEDGSIYVHCDDHVNSHVKLILSDVFGPDSFVNELIWQRTNAHNMVGKYFARVHDTILFF